MNSEAQVLPLFLTEGCKVILFDGECKFFNFWVKFIIKTDSRKVFKLTSMQSLSGQEILNYFDMNTKVFDSMLYVDVYKEYTKSDAILQIMSHLGQPWKLFTMAKIIPVGIRDYLYVLIAVNRYRLFGKYDYCVLPSEEHKDRFLSNENMNS